MAKFTAGLRALLGQLRPQRTSITDSALVGANDQPPPYTEVQPLPKEIAYTDDKCSCSTTEKYTTLDIEAIKSISTAISTTTLNLPSEKASGAVQLLVSGIISFVDLLGEILADDLPTIAKISKKAVAHIMTSVASGTLQPLDDSYTSDDILCIPDIYDDIGDAIDAAMSGSIYRSSADVFIQHYRMKCDIGLAILATRASGREVVAAAVMKALESVADGIVGAEEERREDVAEVYKNCAREAEEAVVGSVVAVLREGGG